MSLISLFTLFQGAPSLTRSQVAAVLEHNGGEEDLCAAELSHAESFLLLCQEGLTVCLLNFLPFYHLCH